MQDKSNDDQSAYLENGIIENTVRSLVKRKANNWVDTSMKNNSPSPCQRSLALVFDATESMSDDLQQLRQGTEKIFNKLSRLDNNPIYNYIFVPFHEENGTIETGPSLVTDDRDKLLNILDNVHLYGGDDCPENMLSGLIESLKYALPGSYVYAFSDASASDFLSESQLVESLQRKQATISLLLTGYCDNKENENYRVYERLTQISNGQIYHIKSNDIEQILNDVSTKLNDHHVLITTSYKFGGGSNRWNFTVDETMSKIHVIITGQGPKIWIYDSNKTNIINETLTLDNAIGHTIDNPSAGIWEIEYVSSGSHSVRITAESTLSLSYGFSIQPVSSLSDASYTPLNGMPNILSIVSSEKVNLIEVHFQPQGENAENSKPIVLQLSERLQTTNTTNYFYETTEAFDPPNDFPFKILVNGYSEKGNLIRRIISTSLQVMDGLPPEIFLNATNVTINEGESLLLECTAHTLVPSTIWMQHEQKQLRELQSNLTTDNVSYEIKSAALEDNGKYTCGATNMYGTSIQIIEIEIKSAPLDVRIPKAEYIGTEYQAEIQIPCTISPESKSSIYTKWKFNEYEIQIGNDGKDYKVSGNNLIILNLRKESSGKYTCIVTAASETNSASTQLIVQYAPLLQELKEEVINKVPYGQPLTIGCSANALPPAQTKWKLPSATEFKILEGPLHIEALSFSDEGQYECLLDNGVEPVATRTVKVRGEANGPPNILKPSIKQLNVSEGDDIVLNCHCEMCDPLNTIFWTPETNEDETNINDDIGEENELANIIDFSRTIKNISLENSGKHTCFIENSHGSDSFSIEVNVKQSPNVKTLYEKSSYHKCVSNPYVNSVELESKSSNVTFPSNVYDCNASDAHRADISVMLLEIDYLLEAHLQKLRAITINSNKPNAISKCSLNALQTPDLTQIISRKGPTVVDLQSNLLNSDVFECIFNGSSPFDAKPLLLLFVTPKSIPENDSKIIQVKSKHNKTTVFKCSTAVTPSKWSKQPYTCESFNNIAATSNPFYFLVQDPPKILSIFDESIRVIRGERSSIACTAAGSPDGLQVYWMDDQSIVSNDSVLNLDTGNAQFNEKNFTCVSKNSFGKDDSMVVVQIIDRPELSNDAIGLAQVEHIKLGEGFNLTCPFDHFNRFDWLKNGEPFNNKTRIIDFQHVSISDAGNYTCRVSNEAGQNEYTYQISVHYSPVIQNSSINDTIIDVTLATNFSIDCQASGFPLPKFEWTHNGDVISSNASLFIDKLDTSNQGDYVCTATNENGASKVAFRLNVLYAPTPETDADRIIEVVQNHSVVLNCLVDANPKPTYEWYKNKAKITGANESYIEVHDVSLIDNGIFECVVTNAVSSSVIPFTLNVFASASIQSVSENSTFDEKDEVVLSCDAIGNPLPVLKWSYDNRVLISSSKSNSSDKSLPSKTFRLDNNTDLIEERFDGDQDNINGVIRYKHPYSIEIELHLNLWPTGVHRFDCSAFNAYGRDDRSTFMEHVLKPTFPLKNDTLIDVSDDVPVALDCDVNGYPVPEITWQKNDIGIDFAVQQAQKYHLENDNKTLHISSITPDDDGESYYSCVATNSIGTGKYVFKLNVLTPPRLSKSNDSTNKFETTLVTRKGAAVFECPVNANPKPKIVWTEKKDDTEKLVKSSEISTLKVDNLHENTVFICYANNSMGNFNYTFKVLVEKAPEILSPVSNEQNFNVGDSFTLKCDISALPEPSISWYKNGDHVTTDGQAFHRSASHAFLSADRKYLQILNTTADDFGEYVCVAENYLGKIKQSFDVIFRPYWGEWSKWGACSEICGKGLTERHRICHQMPSHRNEISCVGDDKEMAQCIREPCKWSKWSECSRTCGEGQKYRYKGKMIEIAPCIRSVCTEKSILDKYTPLITYESPRDTNKVLQQLNRNKNQRGKPSRSKGTKATNPSRSSRSMIFNV
ncbi:hemicentin-1-like [Sitodiplosis mosellana]|uniref:hemicentin-1-like n=1 Tax=Sitodiplosis mosellana TaxID=263140 RepID=UPI002444F17F|nr:hemicentin-1-like [Sitodiplosis mosellana]